MYVSSDCYKGEIELDLLAVGQALSKQSDINIQKTHFPSGYLPNPKKTEDNSSREMLTNWEGSYWIFYVFHYYMDNFRNWRNTLVMTDLEVFWR